MQYPAPIPTLLLATSLLSACDSNAGDLSPDTRGAVHIHSLANGCFSIRVVGTSQFVAASASGEAYEVSAPSLDLAARFFMKPSDLGTYLLFDESEQFLVSVWEKAERRGRELSAGAP